MEKQKNFLHLLQERGGRSGEGSPIHRKDRGWEWTGTRGRLSLEMRYRVRQSGGSSGVYEALSEEIDNCSKEMF